MASPRADHQLAQVIQQLYKVEISQVKHHECFKALCRSNLDKDSLLDFLSLPSRYPIQALSLLQLCLSQLPGPWPTLSVIRCHQCITKVLPESSRSGEDGELQQLIRETSNIVKTSYRSLVDLLSSDSRPALRSSTANESITHECLHQYTSNFSLPLSSTKRKPVVAIALPNGPLLAATCVAVMNYYTAAPINPAAGAEQFKADIQQSGSSCILTTAADFEKLELAASWVTESNISVFILQQPACNSIEICTPQGDVVEKERISSKPNQADDVALILFTSGTSGTKKVVPITLHSIISGTLFVIDSWGLSPDDICLNMMPLYHM